MSICHHFLKRASIALRSLLLIWGVLLAIHSVEAQTYNWKPVKIHGGGFVTGILFHPAEQGLMYCRTDVGGSYRWNPTNDTWIPLLDFIGYPNNEWSLVGTESIGLDAQDPNRLYLSCGWLGNPSEIMISTDRGANFTRINSPFVIRANNDGRGTGERFGVDPNLGSTIFYGTREDGLWKSVNHAANWAKVNSFPVNTTTNGVGISFVEFVRSSGTTGSATPVIWVGVSQTGTNLFRSTDGGLTWTGIATDGVPANCMPLRAAQDGLGNMYVTFCDAAGPGGISTGVVRKFNLSTLASTDVTPPAGQGGFSGVSVDRQNPNRIVVTTANRWWPMSDIYRSTNGGTNWTAVYNGTVDTSSAPWMGGSDGNVVQGWMFDVKIDPYNSDRVYYTTGGGVFSSYNFTATTPAWQFRSTGLEETAFTSIGVNLASPPSGPQLWSVLGDMGGFSHYNLDASPALADYHNPNGANNYGIDFAEQSPNVVVRTYKTFEGERGGYISTDYGRTWSLFPTTPPPAQTDSGPGYVAISADGTRLVWTISGSAPYYSTDRGVTWTPCAGSNLTPTLSWIEPFCFSDRVNPNKFYLYYRNTGRVFVSTDGGASFNLASTITTWGESMRPAYGQEGSLWVAVSDGLWRTTNSGASFSKVPGVQAALTVGFGRTATGTGHPVVYLHGKIGGVWGIYRSEDQGTNWTRINDDQHQYGNIQQVIGDPKIYGRVYVAAGGRGILYGDIYTPPQVTKMIYQDSLVDGWQNWSWATVNTASSAPVRRGTSAASVTAGGWAALSLHRQAAQSTAGYSAVAFWIHGGQNGGQPLQVVSLRNGNTQVFKPITPPLAGTWTRVVIPLSELGLANVWDFDGLWIQNSSGSAISTFHVDDIALIGEADAGTSAPSAPGGPAATAGNAQVALTWNASSGATDYNVKRATVSGGPYTTVTNVTGTSFTNTGLLNGTTYYYVVSALNGFGESVNSSQASATPVAPPPAPDGLAAAAGNAQVGLTWNASSGATSYSVKRATVNGGPYSTINSVTGTGFTDTGVANGTTYFYVVSASNSGGESGNSAQASATPQPPPPPAAPTGFAAAGGNTQAVLNWNTSSGATSYNVKRATVSGGPYTTVGNVTNTSFTNTGLTNGTTYYYVVSALGTGGEGANSAQASTTPQVPAPPAPAGLAATGGNTQVAVTWNASSGAASYNVKRATVSGGPYSTITNVTGTSFTNTGLTNGTTYYYVVSALNAGGESGNSTQASATPSAPLPSPWATADIGAVAAAGNASASGGIFTVIGSGADIWNSSDEFRYVYQPSSGTCEMRAQVTSVQNTDPWAKAGVMIRESTAAGAISAAVFITPSNGVSFQFRTSTGGTTVNTAITGVTAPRYVRLERAANNSFRAYYSSNGTSWTQIGSNQTINMASSATMGLAVTSHNDGTLCTSTITNITATP